MNKRYKRNIRKREDCKGILRPWLVKHGFAPDSLDYDVNLWWKDNTGLYDFRTARELTKEFLKDNKPEYSLED